MPVWGLIAAMVIIGAVFAGFALQPSDSSASPSPDRTARTEFSFGSQTDAPEEAVAVSLLSDSHAFNAGSWWRQTMESGVDGLRIGQWESQPGATAEVLAARLDDVTADGGLVLVQAGTNDLLSGFDADGAFANVEALWDGVETRGGTPIAALVPPNDTRGASVVELNSLIADAAEARGLTLVDVYTAVAGEAGEWASDLSDDGVHANDAGAAVMTDAARDQLPMLTR